MSANQRLFAYESAMKSAASWNTGAGMVKLFSKPPVGLFDDYVQLCHAMYNAQDAKNKISLDFLISLAITLVEYNATLTDEIPPLHNLVMKGVLMYDETIPTATHPKNLLQRLLSSWTPSEVFITQMHERIKREVDKDAEQRGIGITDDGVVYSGNLQVDLNTMKCSQFLAKMMRAGAGEFTKMLFPTLTTLDSKALKESGMVSLEVLRTSITEKLKAANGHVVKRKLISLWSMLDQVSINARTIESIFIFISIISKSGNISDTWWVKRSAALSSSIGYTVQIDSAILAQSVKFFNTHLRRQTQSRLVNMLFGSYHLIKESESAQSLLWIIEQSKGSNLGAVSAIADANGKFAMFSYSTLSRIAGEELPRVCQLLQQMILDPYSAMLTNPIPVRTYANIAYIACNLIYKTNVTATDIRMKVTGYVNTLHTMITIDQGLLDADVINIRESQLQISGDRASLVKTLAKRYGYHISSDKNTVFAKIDSEPSTSSSTASQFDMLTVKTHDMMINDRKYKEIDIGEKYKEMMTKEDVAFASLCQQFKNTMMQSLIPMGDTYQPGTKLNLSDDEHKLLKLTRFNEDPVEYKAAQHKISDNVRRSGSVLINDILSLTRNIGMDWTNIAPPPIAAQPTAPTGSRGPDDRDPGESDED